ncbi:DUF1254 domain-containing protein [Microbulbifer litoralis]|uniref:DUF1254 domain-containing protein n=1 Tax=Microbulbifer litoralis TaxID=2933965 RepID=UPI002027753B|nr:DUF1254 domain-containing protein [Microbulbifer sp. GX H0434]
MNKLVLSTLLASSCSAFASTAQQVTEDTFIQAETERYFQRIIAGAGGTNQFMVFRRPVPLDRQTVIRMNRDTLYAGAVVDTKGGASVTLPAMPDGRYASVAVIDSNHYATLVEYEPGTYKIPDTTRYVMVAARVELKDASDNNEIRMLHRLQDQFSIKTSSAAPFPAKNWDQASLDNLRLQYESTFSSLGMYPDEWQGAPGEPNEETRHLAAAGAWGLLPNRDAVYINYRADLPADGCYTADYTIPENHAFWSITVYGKDGYMQSDNVILNRANTEMHEDDTFTAYFGSENACGPVKNRLDITEGWNFLMRVYRPGERVLKGQYTLPEVEPYSAASS